MRADSVYKGWRRRAHTTMVLRAVAGLLQGSGGVIITVCGNDSSGAAAESFKKEASNPDVGDPSESQATHNPAARRGAPSSNDTKPPVVYRVTSLPLDAYAEAAKNRMRMQEECFTRKQRAKMERGAADNNNKEPEDKGWWGCCWIGWLGCV